MNNFRKWLVVGGVIFLIVAGILGFVASKFGGNKNAGNTAKNKGSASTQQQTGTKLHTPNEAIALVQATYLAASAYIANGNSPNQGEIDAVKNNLDADLYTQLTQTLQVNQATGDQILCTTTGGPMNGYSVNFYRYSGTNALVSVTEKYDTPITVLYTVDLVTLKISNIACQVGQ